jgi:hypothetical protein
VRHQTHGPSRRGSLAAARPFTGQRCWGVTSVTAGNPCRGIRRDCRGQTRRQRAQHHAEAGEAQRQQRQRCRLRHREAETQGLTNRKKLAKRDDFGPSPH